ncbi:hypothetical protein COLO4_07245 [Corchorus olitorius]|uniref:DUF4283 domain-containing protein n=1 Tax=Corchorus olitorius TaxID=93759 RepID=A0A1R3KKD5_9ROSI|nr:hypothetical protein COLO4_07245 [Corchorus olitorius]
MDCLDDPSISLIGANANFLGNEFPCNNNEVQVHLSPAGTKSYKESLRLHAKWQWSLIVKVYGKKVGYKYLVSRIEQLWKIKKQPAVVDLGEDFFLLKFQNEEDCSYVLKKGPWFIGGHFLTVRKWEPNFKASEASFFSVAVWVRLHELPVEFFDFEVLKKIGQAMGTLLRVDNRTLMGERGRYARLCVQINMDKPLATDFMIEGKKQSLVYEGIGTLCFHCGRLGHNADSRPDKVGITATERPMAEEKGFGPWMVVTRKRKSNKSAKNPIPKSNSNSNVQDKKGSQQGKLVNKSRLPEITHNGSNQLPVDLHPPKAFSDVAKRNVKGKQILTKPGKQKENWVPRYFEKWENSKSQIPISASSKTAVSIPSSKGLPCGDNLTSAFINSANLEAPSDPLLAHAMGFLREQNPKFSPKHLPFSFSPISEKEEVWDQDETENQPSPQSPRTEEQTSLLQARSLSDGFDKATEGTVSVQRIAGEDLRATGIVLEPTLCISGGKEPTSGEAKESSTHPTADLGGADYSDNDFSPTVSNRVGTGHDGDLGSPVGTSGLEPAALDPIPAEVFTPCGSDRVSDRQQQTLSCDPLDNSKCETLPRLRSILKSARGVPKPPIGEPTDAQSGCLLDTVTKPSKGRVVQKVAERTKTRKGRRTKSGDDNDCVELQGC